MDPIEEDGGENLYGFVGNCGIMSIDAFGLFDWDGLWEGITGPEVLAARMILLDASEGLDKMAEAVLRAHPESSFAIGVATVVYSGRGLVDGAESLSHPVNIYNGLVDQTSQVMSRSMDAGDSTAKSVLQGVGYAGSKLLGPQSIYEGIGGIDTASARTIRDPAERFARTTTGFAQLGGIVTLSVHSYCVTRSGTLVQTGEAGEGASLATAQTAPLKSLTEQAADLVRLNGGRNRVTLRSPSLKMEVDLAGKSHGVPTPHTKVSPRNLRAPQQPAYNTRHASVEPATQHDIRIVRRYLEWQN